MATTDTFNFTGSKDTWTAPNFGQTITVEMWGAGGSEATPDGEYSYSGGSGGYIKFQYDVNASETLDIYVGEGGSLTAGGWGEDNGGDGAGDELAGGGAGSTVVRDNGGSLLGVADGGGGGCYGYYANGMIYYGGGGGARGGSGGDTYYDGQDGEGSGNGGIGGNAQTTYSGGGGGYEFGSTVTEVSSSIGGGSSQSTNGKIEITYLASAPTPSSPSNLTVDDASTEDELTLGWSSVSSDGYYVYRAESSGSSTGDYTQVANVSNNSYTDTGLEDGEKYYYRVSAYNTSGESGLSNEASGVTPLPSSGGVSAQEN